MTAERRDSLHQSPFLAWLRSVPELDSRDLCISVTDNDCWIHQFAPRQERGPSVKQVVENIQLIETKAFNAVMPFAQRDTLDVVDRILRTKTARGDGKRRPIKIGDSRLGRPGCHRLIRYYGLHILQMSTDRPDRSDRILWDGKDIDLVILIDLLCFRRDPDKPGSFVDSRRHHSRPMREIYPQLFEREHA
jgi:hypothetical protein